MKGGTRKRGAGWEYLYREPDPMTGGRGRLRSKAGFPTKASAEAALRQVLATIDTHSYVSPKALTLAEYLEAQWLPAVAPTLRPATHYSYGRNMRLHVLPALGGVQLQALTPNALNLLYAQLLSGGRLDVKGRGRPLAPKTVRYIHDILSRALQDAFRWQLVSRNVGKLAIPPRPKFTSRPELVTWSPAELQAFLRLIAGHRNAAAYLTLVTTGARRGEILGLAWTDVDLTGGKLHVRRSLVCVTHAPQYSSTKTSKSRRTIALDPATVAALRTHRANQAVEKLAAGVDYNDHGLVFCGPTGGPVHPERFSRTFEQTVKLNHLRRIRLHDLRHTWASLALQAGIHPKIVSERLGHANITITLDIYSHVLPSMHSEAANAVAAQILGS